MIAKSRRGGPFMPKEAAKKTPPAFHYITMKSPLGLLTLTSNGKALTGIYTRAEKLERNQPNRLHQEDAVLKRARKQLEEYFKGQRDHFDLPLQAEGTPFQKLVWKALSRIPYGVTQSYGELARAIGNPKASRAVGMANNRNPFCIVVPCHRVIGADGSLTGYAGGVGLKEWLLNHEKKKRASNPR
jgi:methylated-DNA-[protein]-cysteine S-methyltransferase